MASRRFTILDAMVLVASVGVDFWLTRLLHVSIVVVQRPSSRDDWRNWIWGLSLLMIGLSIGLTVLRPVPPRSPIRRLARQPGSLALIAVDVNQVLATGYSIVQWSLIYRGTFPDEARQAIYDWLYVNLESLSGPWNIGFVVSLAWIIGGIQRFRWSNADWIEWSGRFLGLFLILCWLGQILIWILGLV